MTEYESDEWCPRCGSQNTTSRRNDVDGDWVFGCFDCDLVWTL